MAKKTKILGLSLPVVAATGVAVWYFFLRKGAGLSISKQVTPPFRAAGGGIVQPLSGLSNREISVW